MIVLLVILVAVACLAIGFGGGVFWHTRRRVTLTVDKLISEFFKEPK